MITIVKLPNKVVKLLIKAPPYLRMGLIFQALVLEYRGHIGMAITNILMAIWFVLERKT